MENEVIPEYKTIGKTPAIQSAETIPKHFIPTKRLATILGFIFLAVVILALIQLPYNEILKGNLKIEIGYPLIFLDIGIDTVDELPVDPINLILDLIIYLILAYIIDILISFVINANTTRIRQQEGKGPKVYKAQID